MKNDGGYCCLGVCEMLEGKLTKDGYINGTGNKSILSKSTAKKYGFNGTRGELRQSVLDCRFLTSLNDDEEWTFKEIAEYIENNPENVFTKSV